MFQIDPDSSLIQPNWILINLIGRSVPLHTCHKTFDISICLLWLWVLWSRDCLWSLHTKKRNTEGKRNKCTLLKIKLGQAEHGYCKTDYKNICVFLPSKAFFNKKGENGLERSKKKKAQWVWGGRISQVYDKSSRQWQQSDIIERNWKKLHPHWGCQVRECGNLGPLR